MHFRDDDDDGDDDDDDWEEEEEERASCETRREECLVLTAIGESQPWIVRVTAF